MQAMLLVVVQETHVEVEVEDQHWWVQRLVLAQVVAVKDERRSRWLVVLASVCH